MSHLNQFKEEIVPSSQLAFCQLISPPNLTTPMLKKWVKDGGKFGIFISAEQAEMANFVPDDTWQPTEVGFSGKEDTTVGFITQNPRLVVIHQSKAEVQYRTDTNSRYKFLDLYWNNGAITPAGELAKKDKELHKIVTRHLVLFLGKDDKPLHSEPIQYTSKGAFASSLSVELNNLYTATGESLAAYQKSLGVRSPGKVLTQKARAFCTFQMSISWTRNSDDKSPYCYPSQIVHAALNADEVGTEKIFNRKVKDKFREVLVKKVALDKVLLDMNSPAGEFITQWYQEHLSFSKPNKQAEENFLEENQEALVFQEPNENSIEESQEDHSWDWDTEPNPALKEVPF
jgi:hypothetical protein